MILGLSEYMTKGIWNFKPAIAAPALNRVKLSIYLYEMGMARLWSYKAIGLGAATYLLTYLPNRTRIYELGS